MGKPYSDDLRERVIAAIEAGHTREEVAELFNMALSTVGGFIKRKRETGSVSPDKFGGYKTFSLEPHADLVKKLVAEQPDSTLAELQARLEKRKPLFPSHATPLQRKRPTLGSVASQRSLPGIPEFSYPRREPDQSSGLPATLPSTQSLRHSTPSR